MKSSIEHQGDSLQHLRRTDGRLESNSYVSFQRIAPEDSELWDQMGQLRARVYVQEKRYLEESVLDEKGREFDEYDPSSVHFGCVDDHGNLLGMVRIISRNDDANEGKLQSEMVYETTHPNGAVDLSRFIVDKERVTARDGAYISLALLRAVKYYMLEELPGHKIYAILDKPLIRYFRDYVGVSMEEIGGERQVNSIDSVDALVRIDPLLVTSQIATHELAGNRSGKGANLTMVAPFFEDSQAERGLTRLRLKDIGKTTLECYNRNEVFISPQEQKYLQSEAVVAIAGVGGDGGELAVKLAQMGVHRFKLADPEVFGVENLNRQEGADYTTIGKNKAEVIAARIRAIRPQASIDIYPQGVNEENIAEFVDGAKLVIDETEFTLPHLPVMIARVARSHNLPVMTVLNVAFGAQMTSYTPDGKTVESQLGIPEDMPLDEVSKQNVPLWRWVGYLPSYANMNRFADVEAGRIPTPSIAPGVGIAASIGAGQALAHLLSPINQNRKKQRVIYPHITSHDIYDGTHNFYYPHPNLQYVTFAASAMRSYLRTKLRKNP